MYEDVIENMNLLEDLDITIQNMIEELIVYTKYENIKEYGTILERANNYKEELIKALVKELGSGRGREKRIRKVVDKFL